MKKNFKGFTLIELIVVIAIIGVLAAILVPAMMGWVQKASINSANANAKTVFTAAQTVCQERETSGGTASKADDIKDDVEKSLNGADYTWDVTINDFVVTAAATKTRGYCGGYPNPCPTDTKVTELSKAITSAVAGGKWGK